MNSFKYRHETLSTCKEEGHLHITASQGHQVLKNCCKEYLSQYIKRRKDTEQPLKSIRKKNICGGISKVTKNSFVLVEIQDCQRHPRNILAVAKTGHRFSLEEMTVCYNLLKHELI